MAVLLPFLWPSESLYLQFLVFFCFFLLLLGRVVNVLVPLQYKVVIDALTPGQGSPDTPKTPYFCWLAILIYVSLRFLQGGVGLLSATQNYFWIPVGQWTTRKVSVDAFAHLHSLGMQWHVQRKTGETLRILDRGTSSIVSLLSYILFNIFPVFVDIGIAVIFFVVQFDWVFGVIVLSTMVLYILCTVIVTEWRTQFRKDMIDLDNASRSLAVDSLLNFETVKYFNNEDYEVKRFDEAMQRFMVADRKSQASLNVLNLSQNLVITLGLLAGSLLAAREVVDGTLTTGDFVMFLTYLTQLYGPLNFMGTYYRLIQQSFIDMEKLIELFKERQTVKDKPNAKEIKFDKGEVVFENVSFSYDPRHPALKNVSFRIPAGKTVALVGHSGSGKTSVTRLLFRFYDVNSGRVLVDGVDVRDVTQKSLRAAIGVVPQDTVLFNDTIMHNIRYGKPSATDEEVIAAAKAAQLHDRIMTFPDGYNTKVGERGLRLSGGEKQRVAIARTMLKDPTIIILDEATSAMDSITERAIQESFKELCKDRSTLAIAHRLTTVQDADVIIVLKEGEIVEQGPFDELIKRGPGGHFYELWETRKKAEESGAADKPEEKKEARTERIGGHGGHGGGHGGHGGGHGR
ncbi:P-loop containing nucleoside triphosphate hydrolase protein [Hyaloraphidium curvatum]|nr:P-loop containing nucleoside triphosphate hydrolase protein [Hyaloraphidium curvatum]